MASFRPRGRHRPRPRRLDAQLRRRAAFHGRLRDRRRQPADLSRAGPRFRPEGDRRRHRLHVRRRGHQHRQLRRDDEPGGALEAADRLPRREQPLRDGDLDRAPLRRHRPLPQGRGGLGVPGERVDGMDVVAIRECVADTSDRARGTAGPTWSRPSPIATGATPRPTPRSTGRRRRSRSGGRRDPIETFARRLIEAKGINDSDLARPPRGGREADARRPSSSPTSPPSRRWTRSTTTSTWSKASHGGWYAVDERTPDPFRGEREREAAKGERVRDLHEAGATYAGQSPRSAGGGRGAGSDDTRRPSEAQPTEEGETEREGGRRAGARGERPDGGDADARGVNAALREEMERDDRLPDRRGYRPGGAFGVAEGLL